jgi:hypothetical protein
MRAMQLHAATRQGRDVGARRIGRAERTRIASVPTTRAKSIGRIHLSLPSSSRNQTAQPHLTLARRAHAVANAPRVCEALRSLPSLLDPPGKPMQFESDASRYLRAKRTCPTRALASTAACDGHAARIEHAFRHSASHGGLVRCAHHRHARRRCDAWISARAS